MTEIAGLAKEDGDGPRRCRPCGTVSGIIATLPAAVRRHPRYRLGIVTTVVLFMLVAARPPAAAEPYIIPLDAVGRVLDADHLFKCTGFVVESKKRTAAAPGALYYEHVSVWYENFLVTAGHCLVHVKYFASRDGYAHAVHSIVGYSDHQNGFDVLVATFTTFTPVPTLEPVYAYTLQPGEKLMMLGYGRTALQINVNPFLGYSGRGDLIVDGISGPGDSGSPVLIPGTRKVVGILHSGTVNVPLEGQNNPYYCMFQSCASTAPYHAAPIDRIQGIIRN